MLNKLKRAWKWVLALRAYEADDTQRALGQLRGMETIETLRPYEVAFLGQCQVLAGDSVAAVASFSRAKELLGDREGPNAAYVRIFSDVYLTLISAAGPVKDLVAEADALNCRPSLKRWLPLTPASDI
jgi:hypothetical protein